MNTLRGRGGAAAQDAGDDERDGGFHVAHRIPCCPSGERGGRPALTLEGVEVGRDASLGGGAPPGPI